MENFMSRVNIDRTNQKREFIIFSGGLFYRLKERKAYKKQGLKAHYLAYALSLFL